LKVFDLESKEVTKTYDMGFEYVTDPDLEDSWGSHSEGKRLSKVVLM